MEFVHGRPVGRSHGQTAHVNHARTTYNKAVRISKDDIATDLAILEPVEGAVDDGT